MRLVRYAAAAVVLYAVMRAAPTVDGMRDVMFGALYFLGAVCAVSMAVSLCEYVAIDFGKKWRARVFDPCGVLDFNGEPCMLPDGHGAREHATGWVVTDAGTATLLTIEQRHRFDDVAAEGRIERRYGRGQLAKVMSNGDVPTPVGK